MINELSQIKVMRKKLSMTQTQLAKIAGVSQSLIAKIEAEHIDPTYSNVQKIFTALNDFGKKHELKASEIMNVKVISAEPNDDIEDVIKKIRKFGISQMPVISDHKSVGLVTEAIILDAILNKKGKKVSDIMADSPPIVPKNTSANAIIGLLQFAPMILVSENGKLEGVITKADAIEKMYGGKSYSNQNNHL